MPGISVTVSPVTKTTVISPVESTEISTIGYLSAYIPRSESGKFYPSSNPSGFASGIDASLFVLNISTGNYTGLFYPLRNNPSGYITSGQTGLFGSLPNISGTAPLTNILSIPVSINVYGATSKLIGEPNGWISSVLSGQNIKIPYYL